MKNIFLYGLIVVIVAILSTSITNAFDRRFSDNGDSTITDTQTKLIWDHPNRHGTRNKRKAEIACAYNMNPRNVGWRLPTIDELTGILNYVTQQSGPAGTDEYRKEYRKGIAGFGIVADRYWTATGRGYGVNDGKPYYQVIDFATGQVLARPEDEECHAWCVRDGQ